MGERALVGGGVGWGVEGDWWVYLGVLEEGDDVVGGGLGEGVA